MFYILFRQMLLKGNNDFLVKYEAVCAQAIVQCLTESIVYKYVDNGNFFRSIC